MRKLLLVSMVALALSGPGVAAASTAHGTASFTNLRFSTPDFQWLNNAGGGQYYIWNVGDYWQQTFTGTGLNSINRIKFNLSLTNVLTSGHTVQVDVYVNGTKLAHITFVSGQASFVTRAITIPALNGPDYTIQFLETNQVPAGDGSVSLNIDGPSYVTIGSL